MNKKYYLSLLAFLFALQPLKTQAQTLTGYEYWFDGKVGDRVSESLNGDEAVINTTVETQHLSSGLHTLHLRLKQSGGEYEYSPVTSQIFFKHNAKEGGQIEYWFDDDITKSATVPLPAEATEDTVNVALTMTDAMKFPLGFHLLNMRVSTEGKSLGCIYTAHVLKVPSGEIDILEYWVDDDFDNRQTVEGHVASTDENSYIFLNPFDLSNVPSGPHRIYYRPASKNGAASGAVSMTTVIVGGGTPSKIEYWFDNDVAKSATVTLPASAMKDTVDVALVMNNSEKFPFGFHQLSMRMRTENREQSPVYSARVLKKASGKVDVLEYWVDDDFDNRHAITGKAASNGDNAYIFNDSLNLGNISEGFHRIYYRATSSKGNANSAVSMTPVMVKSRYNVDNKETLTVTEQAYWFDNEEPEIRFVSNPKNNDSLTYTFDARKLSDGQHTLHLQFGNSAEIWNSPATFTFTKTKVNEPLIVANANVDNGIVTLKFNSVPYGQDYTIVRQYPSGTVRKVETIKTTDYPTVLTSIDKPASGTYIYYVDGGYLDANGNKQRVRSGNINVTVENTSEDVKRGTIHGKIKLNGNDAGPGFTFSVYINGERATAQSEYRFSYDGYGGFKIGNIPYNTEMRIGIKRNHYKFNDLTLIVNETTTNSPKYFNGTRSDEEEEEILPENESFDLQLVDKIVITQNGWEIPIRNLSSKIWSGNLIVKVISKVNKEKYGIDYSLEENSALDFLYYNSDIYFTTIADMSVEIQGYRQGNQIIVLDIKDMPNAKKNEDYYVYVFSKKDNTGETKMLDGSDPQVLKFNPSDFKKEIMSYMDVYADIFSYLKKISDWGDPFKLGWKTAKEEWGYYLKLLERSKHDADANELLDDAFNAYLRSAGLLMNCFYGEINEKIIKSFKGNKIYEAAEGIADLYEKIKPFYDDGTSQVNDYTSFFKLAGLVLKYGAKNDPLVAIYKTYFEVGEAMVKAIENMTNNIHDYDIWEKLYNGKGIYRIKIRKYPIPNEGIRYFNGEDFYEHKEGNKFITHDGQIKSIEIRLVDSSNNEGLPIQINDNNIEFVNDGIVIKNVKFPTIQGIGTNNVEAWMTINWKNDRVTYIPLLDEHFAKLEKKDDSLILSVELQSGSYYEEKSIPNHLTFVNPK